LKGCRAHLARNRPGAVSERVLLVRVPFGARPLSSPLSAADRSALFEGFTGTTGPSDFPESCIIGVRPLAFPMRPTAPSAVGDSGISRFSRMEAPHVRGVCDRAGPPAVSRSRRRACCLPLRITASVRTLMGEAWHAPARQRWAVSETMAVVMGARGGCGRAFVRSTLRPHRDRRTRGTVWVSRQDRSGAFSSATSRHAPGAGSCSA
jgi:hypothetical protein